jgi:hypothetical protein
MNLRSGENGFDLSNPLDAAGGRRAAEGADLSPIDQAKAELNEILGDAPDAIKARVEGLTLEEVQAAIQVYKQALGGDPEFLEDLVVLGNKEHLFEIDADGNVVAKLEAIKDQQLLNLPTGWTEVANYAYVKGALDRGDPILFRSNPNRTRTHYGPKRAYVRITSHEIAQIRAAGWKFYKIGPNEWVAAPPPKRQIGPDGSPSNRVSPFVPLGWVRKGIPWKK